MQSVEVAFQSAVVAQGIGPVLAQPELVADKVDEIVGGKFDAAGAVLGLTAVIPYTGIDMKSLGETAFNASSLTWTPEFELFAEVMDEHLHTPLADAHSQIAELKAAVADLKAQLEA